MTSPTDTTLLLGRRINLPEIKSIVNWALNDTVNIEALFDLAKSHDERTSANALWCLTHLQKFDGAWLRNKHDELIDMLLAENHIGRRRMLLQILRHQTYDKTNFRTDFLDYCLSKINAECEPYAIRCFCIYCAFNICRLYPDLLSELECHLEMLSFQSLSPGLASALKTTLKKIAGEKLLIKREITYFQTSII